MARNPQGHVSLLLWLVLSLHISYLMTAVDAKSGRPITDAEIRMKKDECYTDIESGLWGFDCKVSITAKENCALRCLSPRCYELVYESDPLEEGEKDVIRNQEYKYCMYRSKFDAFSGPLPANGYQLEKALTVLWVLWGNLPATMNFYGVLLFPGVK
ncbi:hypothetical protein SOVF_111260 isoform C [Spinacia oleracea]|nr:hypothetical protein SOVF_111260 isoform C [Spinacia oleracea]